MNAREHTVTVSPESPDPAATVANVQTATPPLVAPTGGPTVGSATTAAPSSTTPPGQSDFTWPLILGVTASIAAVLIARAAATGKLPWINRGPPKP